MPRPPLVVDPVERDGAAGPVRGRAELDGQPTVASLTWYGAERARVRLEPSDGSPSEARVLLLPAEPATAAAVGVVRREVIVDGWRVEVEVEPEARARLRERASRARGPAAHSGPLEIRAIIPGRVVSVAVVPGDTLTAGQQVMVVEAMKMQNEIRTPRDGEVARVAVAAGDTIEVGDTLLVIG